MDDSELVIVQMWIGDEYKGYRTISNGFYHRLRAYLASPLCRINVFIHYMGPATQRNQERANAQMAKRCAN